MPALFQPMLGAPTGKELAMFGLADAPQSVLRIARRAKPGQGFRRCSASSSNAGDPCRSDGRCPGGNCEVQTRCLPSNTSACTSDADCTPTGDECGQSAHQMASRKKDGVGPVEIPRVGTTGRVCNGGPHDGKTCAANGNCPGGAPCVDYRAQALWHAPLQSTVATDDLVVTVLSEFRLNRDLDGDNKTDSMVAMVYERSGLELLPYGETGAPGRAVVSSAMTVGSKSFDFPVVAAAGPVVALVEDCAKRPTPACDGTPGKTARLRVYRLAGNALAEVTKTVILPEPDDFVDGQRIAVTPAGVVFYRARQGPAGPVMLHALEGRVHPPEPPVALCPASLASVGGERIAFLRPESDGGCASEPPTPVDLNDDGDTSDTVVHRWSRQDGLDNLHCGATQVAMREDWIAATVSEAQQNGSVLNGDGDALDAVLAIHPAVGQSPSCEGPTSRWRNTQQAADRIAISGSAIPLLTPEAEQGADLDGDGSQDDHVIQVAFATPAPGPIDFVNLKKRAEEFAVGDPVTSACGPQHLLAFRTEVGGDSKLQIYRLQNQTFGPAVGTAVRVCDDLSCDPRRPYQVDGNIVRVLETTDDCPLGSAPPCSAIQVYDVCRDDPSTSLLALPRPAEDALDAFFLRGGGNVELGTGRCVENLRVACKPGGACRGASVCRPVRPGAEEHACFADRGWCHSAGDCPTQAECRPALSLAYDGDEDADGVPNSVDLCPRVADAEKQIDRDKDGFGHACDRDDGDERVH